MTIAIISFVLVGVLALMGFFLGLVRSLVMLLGIVLAGFLALPLGPHLKGIFPSIGVSHPVWLWIWPPVLAFVLIWVVFVAASFAANLPVTKYFKFRADDVQRVRWERLSPRVGAFVGALGGLMCVIWLGVGIYVTGYFTFPFANEENDPIWLRYLNKARTEMASLGMDRTVSTFDPMPEKYYQVADTLGFLYVNNPAVVSRLSSYPPFLTYGERQEIKETVDDKPYLELLQKKPGLMEVLNQPRTQGFINNPDLWQALAQIDLKDFNGYLKTGKSALYDPIKLLGHWDMDLGEIMLKMKKKKLDLSKSDLEEIEKKLIPMAAGSTLTATTDNKVTLALKGKVVDMARLKQLQDEAAANAPPPAIAPPGRGGGGIGGRGVSGIPSALRQRYTNPNAAPYPTAPPPGLAPAGAAPPRPIAIPYKDQVTTIQGSWDGESDSYRFTLRNDRGQSDTVDAMIDGDQLVFKAFGQDFVFVHQ